MGRIRLYIPLVVIYICALLVLLDFFTDGLADGAGRLLALWVSLISGILLLLGLGNIVLVHLQRIRSGQTNPLYSIVLLVSMVLVIFAGVLGRVTNQGDNVTNLIYQYVYQPLATTLFALLAFLMISATVRALRINTIESTLLVIGALIVLLGQIAFSPFNNLASLSQWFQDYPVLGVIRGILIGTALGAITTSLRYMLGVENQYLR